MNSLTYGRWFARASFPCGSSCQWPGRASLWDGKPSGGEPSANRGAGARHPQYSSLQHVTPSHTRTFKPDQNWKDGVKTIDLYNEEEIAGSNMAAEATVEEVKWWQLWRTFIDSNGENNNFKQLKQSEIFIWNFFSFAKSFQAESELCFSGPLFHFGEKD